MASLTDDNEAGGNLDKRNIWLIGVGHTSRWSHEPPDHEYPDLFVIPMRAITQHGQ